MIQIANPIYDVVFKYLLDDNKVAKIFLSAILEEEILELEYRPKEVRTETEKSTLTVYRMDFSAKIKTAEGDHRLVIIEIQKAKYHTDIMRFRKYLGSQYADPNNMYVEEEGVKYALPIISMYFLGHSLKHTEAPVIKVKRNYIDMATGEELKEKEEFIESLTHDSYVIQIPKLKEKRRNELEMLLSIFDQGESRSNNHVLNIREENFPEKYQLVIRRLQRAIAETKVRDTMDLEDEILGELEDMERTIAKKNELIEESKKVIEEKEKALQVKDKALEEKDKTLQENTKILNKKDLAIKEQEKIIEELKRRLEE